MRKNSSLSFVVWFLIISCGFIEAAWADKTPRRSYQYVSLDAALPEGFNLFDPVSITNSGRVYGTLCDAENCFVAVYHRGEITPLEEGFAATANNRRTVGGAVLSDPDLGTFQAALFKRDEVELIPPLPDEIFASVSLLTDSRIALVESIDSNGNLSRYLTKRGHVTPLNFGSDFADLLDINNRGTISGSFRFREDGGRAFRYDPFSGRLTILDPLPTEPESWGLAINKRGDVLGYSFVGGGLERIGVWRGTRFHTYFVEGTPEFPTVSNSLLWNERGLIVITDASRPAGDLNSYLVPRPGVRLNLADLTDRPLPAWTNILDINERGDLIGVGGAQRSEMSSRFLLRRVDGEGRHADGVVVASSLESAESAPSDRGRHPPALDRIRHERWFGRPGKDRAGDGAESAAE
jgi:hypothetical protein